MLVCSHDVCKVTHTRGDVINRQAGLKLFKLADRACALPRRLGHAPAPPLAVSIRARLFFRVFSTESGGGRRLGGSRSRGPPVRRPLADFEADSDLPEAVWSELTRGVSAGCARNESFQLERPPDGWRLFRLHPDAGRLSSSSGGRALVPHKQEARRGGRAGAPEPGPTRLLSLVNGRPDRGRRDRKAPAAVFGREFGSPK